MASLPYGELKIPGRLSKKAKDALRETAFQQMQMILLGGQMGQGFWARRAPPGLFERRLREAEEAKKRRKRTKPLVETGFTPAVMRRK